MLQKELQTIIDYVDTRLPLNEAMRQDLTDYARQEVMRIKLERETLWGEIGPLSITALEIIADTILEGLVIHHIRPSLTN